MKNIFLYSTLLFLLSCAGPPPKIVSVKYDTIKSLDSLKENDTTIFKSTDRKTYKVMKTAQTPDESEDIIENNKSATTKPKVKNDACTSETFDGSDRKKAKLSFSTAREETFANLAAFLATLPSDASMGSTHNPVIKTDSTSNRVKEEKRNVHVLHAYIFAFSRETDEDYHVIIGTTNNKSTAVFFNAEISGLPKPSSSSYTSIFNARKKFKDHFGLNNNCQGGYVTRFIDNPVEVELKGSLFFDELHYVGHKITGPPNAKTATFWEIHPIKDIIFL
jgi:hypothetical protein